MAYGQREDGTVDLSFSPEHDELRAVVRAFFAARSSETDVRRLMADDAGYDRDVWAQMAQQLGLQAMAVPESFGGAGFGPRELSIVMEEAGRALLCAPLLSSAVLATTTLLECGADETTGELLPALAAGDEIATLALIEGSGRFDVDSVATTALNRDGGWALTGHKSLVLDAHVADAIILAARHEAGVSLFVVRRGANGMTVTPAATMDQTRRLADVDLNGTPARLVGEPGAAPTVLRRVLDLAGVMLAAEQVGGAGRVLEMAVEYAGVREQFGGPIGRFQAIKHKCADMFVALESARSAAYWGAWAAAEAPEELPAAASVAQTHCSWAYYRIAADNIQIHGGIGFTWEHPAHLYFKRASSSKALLGSADVHRDRLAIQLGI